MTRRIGYLAVVALTLMLLAFGAAIFTALMLPQPAFAEADSSEPCSAFYFGPDKYEVKEGAGKVTVTVRRAGPQGVSVRVRSLNGTATAGQDYTAVDTRVSWGLEDGYQRTVDIEIIDDSMVEGNEQFTIKLSDGEGCPGVGFVYGDPATVAIVDNDQAAAVAPPAPREAGSPPPAGTEPSPTDSPAPAEILSIHSTPGGGLEIEDDGQETGTVVAAADEEDDGGSAVPIIVAIALIVAGGAGGGLWWLRRHQA